MVTSSEHGAGADPLSFGLPKRIARRGRADRPERRGRRRRRAGRPRAERSERRGTRRRPGRAQSGGTAGPLRYPVPVTPEELANAIHAILLAAAGDGALDLPVEQIPVPRVERPRNREHGDWSTNVAMLAI